MPKAMFLKLIKDFLFNWNIALYGYYKVSRRVGLHVISTYLLDGVAQHWLVRSSYVDLLVITTSFANLRGSVDLFNQHCPRKLMRKCHGR